MLCLSGFEILLSLGAPKPCVLFCIYNWSVWRKVQASELDIVDKTAALDAFEEKVKKKIKEVQGNGCKYFSSRYSTAREKFRPHRLMCDSPLLTKSNGEVCMSLYGRFIDRYLRH